MNEAIIYTKEGVVAHVVLNRPQAINALNMRMRDGLYEALEAVRDDPGVRVAVLWGAGERGFCAGADLAEFGTAPSQAVARQARWQRDVWGLLADLRKPLVVALHGYVLGAGLELACLCDIRLASDDAKLGAPEVSLGLIPGAGGTQTLPRAIGQARALELTLARPRRWLTAAEALAWGLVHCVVPRQRLLQEARRLASELASRDPAVVAAVKSAVLEGIDLPLADGLRLERRLAVAMAARRT